MPALPVILYILLIVTALVRRLPFHVRATVLVLVPYLLSLDSLFNFGIGGATKMMGGACILLAGILIGVRAGVAAFVVYLATAAFCGYLVLNGHIILYPPARELSLEPRRWFETYATFTIIMSTLLYSVMFLTRRSKIQYEKLQDETREKNAALAAEKKAAENYKLLADNVRDIIWTMDLNGNMTYVSPSVESIRGVTPEEAIAGGMSASGPPENMAIFANELQAALKLEEAGEADPERTETFALQLYHKDGSTLDAEIKMNFIRGDDGAPVGILGVTRDVTDRKKLEQQLHHSQRMESIGQLAGGIAHDFNNLLMVILGYADLTSRTKDVDSIQNYMGEIRNAAERGAIMTKQLLAFSRRQIMSLEPINVCDLVAGLNDMIRSVMPENIDIEVNAAQTPLYVNADYGQLEQVLTNLMLNARDAMPGGGHLRVEILKERLDKDFAAENPWAREGEFVVMRVADTGHGMTREVQERIFEPFYSTKPEGKGSGLGLPMVFGTVKQHDGFIHVTSTVGQGSEFAVYLPIIHEPLLAETPEAGRGDLAGTETILLVEDERQVRELGSVILREAGYNVIEAENGLDAMRTYERNKDDIDLILLDVVMPRMGGEEVMRAIREGGGDVPILFTSGYSESAIHTDFILNEELNLIAKPYGPDQLKRKIRDVLD